MQAQHAPVTPKIVEAAREVFAGRRFDALPFYVYHLVDPVTNQVFYVGKGSGIRVHSHTSAVLRGAKLPNLSLHNRIAALIHLGKRPKEILVFETDNALLAFEKESAEIKRLGRATLCNLTNGGEGVSGYRWSEFARQKLRALLKGRVVSESLKQKHADQSRSSEPFVFEKEAREVWIEGIGWVHGVPFEDGCILHMPGITLTLRRAKDGKVIMEIIELEKDLVFPHSNGKDYLLKKTPNGGLQLVGLIE